MWLSWSPDQIPTTCCYRSANPDAGKIVCYGWILEGILTLTGWIIAHWRHDSLCRREKCQTTYFSQMYTIFIRTETGLIRLQVSIELVTTLLKSTVIIVSMFEQQACISLDCPYGSAAPTHSNLKNQYLLVQTLKKQFSSHNFICKSTSSIDWFSFIH